MRQQIYLVLDRKGVRRMTTKRRPALHQNERCIALDIIVPNSVFDSPVMSVRLEVPESHVQFPKVEIQSAPPEPQP